jgi:hypothetical protein
MDTGLLSISSSMPRSFSIGLTTPAFSTDLGPVSNTKPSLSIEFRRSPQLPVFSTSSTWDPARAR